MWRCRRLLDEARHHSCQAPGCGGSEGVVAAHSNQGRHGKGLGIKAHDCFVGFMCHWCHVYVDCSSAPIADRTAVWRGAFERSVPLFRRLLDEEGLAMVQAELQGAR